MDCRFSGRALSALLVLFLLAAGQAAPAQVKMPRLDYRERTLANGLRVLSAEDRSSPTVAIQVWYHVGSKDDPTGRSGFAHLFEHIMFKSTRNMKAEMMDRLTEDVGGFNNAFTADDMTVYYEVVPSNYLETLLWAEADRLSGLNVDEANFKSERDVVKEEYRQSVLAPPFGRFDYLLQQKSFLVHPYKRPTIGSIEDLDAASLADVQAFHATFYRPDNATLIVVGDFDQKQLDGWVDKYLAPIARPNTLLPRVTIKEPPRKSETRFTENVQNVPLPAIGLTYLTAPKASPDAESLRVAEAILSAGESSRLYHSLVYDQQVAQSVSASANLLEDVGLFLVNAIVAGGKKPEDAEASLLAEIKKMQDAPVSKAELDKAINQIVTNQLRERETNNGKALALGEAAVLLGDPNRVNTDLSRLQAVTAADVQLVMKKYFTDTNRLVLYYLPEAAKSDKSANRKPVGTSDAQETVSLKGGESSQSTVLVADKQNRPELIKDSKGKSVNGSVRVKILIDENGNVIKAKAVSGHPLLRKVSEQAALKAKFRPTLVGGVAVKVSGEIVYNFVAEQKEKANAQ